MIRKAEAFDASRLSELHAAAFSPAWSEADFLQLLSDPQVVALTSGEKTGFILIRSVVDEAEILTFAVAPDARRSGLGRALLRAALDLAHDLGVASVFLEVAADNEAALGLYESEGFETVGRRRGYYARGVGLSSDAILLRRRASTPA